MAHVYSALEPVTRLAGPWIRSLHVHVGIHSVYAAVAVIERSGLTNQSAVAVPAEAAVIAVVITDQ